MLSSVQNSSLNHPHGCTSNPDNDQENQFQNIKDMNNVGNSSVTKNLNNKAGLNPIPHRTPLGGSGGKHKTFGPQKGENNGVNKSEKKIRRALGDISNKVNQNSNQNNNNNNYTSANQNRQVGNPNSKNFKSKGLSARKLAPPLQSLSSSSSSSILQESNNYVVNKSKKEIQGGSSSSSSSSIMKEKDDSSFDIEACFGRGYKEEEMVLETIRRNRLNDQMDKEIREIHSNHIQSLQRKGKGSGSGTGAISKSKDVKNEMNVFGDQSEIPDIDTFDWNPEQDMEIGEVINELGLEDEDFLL